MFDSYAARAVTAMILWSVGGTLVSLSYYNHSIAKLGLKEVDAITHMLTLLVAGAIWGTVFGPLASFPRRTWYAHGTATAILLFAAFLGHRFAPMFFGTGVASYFTMYWVWLAVAFIGGLVGSRVDSRRNPASPRCSDA